MELLDIAVEAGKVCHAINEAETQTLQATAKSCNPFLQKWGEQVEPTARLFRKNG